MSLTDFCLTFGQTITGKQPFKNTIPSKLPFLERVKALATQ